MTATLPPETEREFQKCVIDLAHANGFRVAHFRPARTAKGWRTACQADAKGFPDLVIVGHGRLIFAELKSEKGKTSPEQREWLYAIMSCMQAGSGVEFYTWRPSDWPDIKRTLSR